MDEVNSRDTVRFVLDDEIVELGNVPPTMTVLDYLRDVRGRTGTKEGCAEGDCGACTVVLGELSEDGSRIDYRAVNSCIRFLPTIDGKELVTVESLQPSRDSLHPVQQAMVDEHASQCGFCTPGFVMSLFGLYLNEPAPSREDVVTALSGNLCRCTGYRPIIDAGCTMSSYPQPAKWGRDDAQSGARVTRLRNLQSDAALSYAGFVAPTSIDDLAAILEKQPESLLLAGGTDVGLWVTKQLRDLPPIVYIGAVPELKEMRTIGPSVRIGAAVSLTRRLATSDFPLSHAEGAGVALRFAAGMQRRHVVWKHREWLAGRGLDADADGARRRDRVAPWPANAPRAVGRVLSRLPTQGSAAWRVCRRGLGSAASARGSYRKLQSLETLRPGHRSRVCRLHGRARGRSREVRPPWVRRHGSSACSRQEGRGSIVG